MKLSAIKIIAMSVVCVSACITACHAGSIGPNASPYFAVASNAPFVDITGSGTRVLAHTDDATTTANLGFSFQFIGASSYTSAWISSNGVMGFGAPDNSPANVSLSDSGVGPVIASLWDDWQFVTPGTDGVYYETAGDPGNQTFTVEWHNAASTNFLARGLVSFEATLNQAGDILFSYANTSTGDYRTNNGASATVGIAGPGNGEYVQWSFNQGIIGSNSSVLVDPPPPGLSFPLLVTQPIYSASTPVPEPSTIVLMVCGVAAMVVIHRKNIF